MSSSARRLSSRRPQAGFSMIETMIVIGIIGILVNLAVPIYSESRLRAQVASIVGDYQAVRAAVSDYYLTNQEWPADADPGQIPPELVEYLGDRVNWSSPYIYDYDYFADSAGNPTQPEAGVLVGFSVRDADPRLVALLQAARPGPLTETWGNGVTFIIQPALTTTGASPEESPDLDTDEDAGDGE